MGKIWIGTSGFTYSHWRGPFYPEILPYQDFLKFYSQHFDTVEINSSFYHLPREITMENWFKSTPGNFILALKASRYISHVKKLKDCEEPLERFLNRARILKEKLGPILFQFPPSWRINLDRLTKFLKVLPKGLQATFEFRHESWFTERVFSQLKNRNCALTIADAPRYPLVEKLTADFVYIRLHGHERLYASKYTKEELKSWARNIRRWSKNSKLIYVYFDNDAEGFAVQNAKTLKKLLAVKATIPFGLTNESNEPRN